MLLALCIYIYSIYIMCVHIYHFHTCTHAFTPVCFKHGSAPALICIHGGKGNCSSARRSGLSERAGAHLRNDEMRKNTQLGTLLQSFWKKLFNLLFTFFVAALHSLLKEV